MPDTQELLHTLRDTLGQLIDKCLTETLKGLLLKVLDILKDVKSYLIQKQKLLSLQGIVEIILCAFIKGKFGSLLDQVNTTRKLTDVTKDMQKDIN
ncbi:hypothetical protein OPQ81_000704 [Rhizoctonia solani]|nr:hypothetical protein OPQ81_000704 [Rhizoctonia solani]